MDHINKIEFDEDLVLIMTSFITTSKRIPQEGVAFFPLLTKYLKKNKGLMLDLFELLNAYIIYGGEFFESNEENIKILYEMIKKSITEFSDYEKSAYLAYNLIGILLQVKNYKINFYLIIKYKNFFRLTAN